MRNKILLTEVGNTCENRSNHLFLLSWSQSRQNHYTVFARYLSSVFLEMMISHHSGQCPITGGSDNLPQWFLAAVTGSKKAAQTGGKHFIGNDKALRVQLDGQRQPCSIGL